VTAVDAVQDYRLWLPPQTARAARQTLPRASVFGVQGRGRIGTLNFLMRSSLSKIEGRELWIAST
jgi:hypothetical protein